MKPLRRLSSLLIIIALAAGCSRSGVKSPAADAPSDTGRYLKELKNRDLRVREEAAQRLGVSARYHDFSKVVPALARALDDPDPWVQFYAHNSLRRLTGNEQLPRERQAWLRWWQANQERFEGIEDFRVASPTPPAATRAAASPSPVPPVASPVALDEATRAAMRQAHSAAVAEISALKAKYPELAEWKGEGLGYSYRIRRRFLTGKVYGYEFGEHGCLIQFGLGPIPREPHQKDYETFPNLDRVVAYNEVRAGPDASPGFVAEVRAILDKYLAALREIDRQAGVSCFVGAESRGLALNAKGELVRGATVLSVALPQGKIFAAALHPRAGLLTVVTADATAIGYRLEGGTYVEIKRVPPGVKAQIRTVRFSYIPGLLYLLYDDVKVAESIRGRPVQNYSDRYSRVALTEAAELWHAVPWGDPQARFLPAMYCVRDRTVHLEIFFPQSEGTSWDFDLPEALGEPFRSGPGDDLAQAVFLFPNRGIVCRTASGWTLHDHGGRLLGSFSAAGVRNGWWHDPTEKDGQFYAYFQTGPGGDDYRLDAKAGKLVKVERGE